MDIDLNTDLGEGYGPWRMGEDEALLGLVSSANVACGFHAGDPAISAVAAFDPTLIVSSSSSRAIEGAAAQCGLRVATTFLADRAYDDEGLLVPRKLPDSVIEDEARVLERVRRLLENGSVVTYSGKTLAMRPRSILLHGDTPGAVALARTVRGEIEARGHRIVPISRQAF